MFWFITSGLWMSKGNHLVSIREFMIARGSRTKYKTRTLGREFNSIFMVFSLRRNTLATLVSAFLHVLSMVWKHWCLGILLERQTFKSVHDWLDFSLCSSILATTVSGRWRMLHVKISFRIFSDLAMVFLAPWDLKMKWGICQFYSVYRGKHVVLVPKSNLFWKWCRLHWKNCQQRGAREACHS